MTQVIGPQPGPQEAFMSSSADIVIYGGAAGGGKTFAELLEPVRHISIPDFGAVIFRRESPQITNEGGLWDESMKLYPLLGAEPKASTLEWRFPSGATVSFGHMEHEPDVLKWHGSQIPLIEFDELTMFSEKQFWYMLSRNRSTCGVRPYIRATCNPDPDSFVANLIAWWIEQDERSANYGYPIAERGGVIRWFVRVDDNLVWGDSREELAERFPMMAEAHAIKSLTFIPSKVEDNKILLEKNPEYLGNLLSLSTVERERLHRGNWKVRPDAQPFKREKVQMAAALPNAPLCYQLFMDLAYTKKKQSDHTAWVVTATDYENRLFVVESGKRKVNGGELLNLVFDLMKKYVGCGIVGAWIEGHILFLETTLPDEQRRRNRFFAIHALKHEGVAKADRIRDLENSLHSVWMLPGNADLIAELVAWSPASTIDDLCDTLAYARKEALQGRPKPKKQTVDTSPKIWKDLIAAQSGKRPRGPAPITVPTRA